MKASPNGRVPWDQDVVTIPHPPSPREVYWIGSPTGSAAPEFTGYHPGVIVRGVGGLHAGRDTVTFVPITSTEPRRLANGQFRADVWQLGRNPNPNDDRPVWAICSHLYTVKVTRLETYRTRSGPKVGKVTREDFGGIMSSLMAGFGTIRNLVSARVDADVEERMARERLAMEAEFERRVEERARELAENFTAPAIGF